MLFEWDEKKELLNYKKHKIHFDTATKVFADSNRVIKYDKNHSIFEDRFIVIGCCDELKDILFVVYCERQSAIRIISARHADTKEKGEYYGCSQRN